MVKKMYYAKITKTNEWVDYVVFIKYTIEKFTKILGDYAKFIEYVSKEDVEYFDERVIINEVGKLRKLQMQLLNLEPPVEFEMPHEVLTGVFEDLMRAYEYLDDFLTTGNKEYYNSLCTTIEGIQLKSSVVVISFKLGMSL